MKSKQKYLISTILFPTILLVFTQINFSQMQNFQNETARLVRTGTTGTFFDLMGVGLSGAPTFREGLASFRQAKSMKLTEDEIIALRGIIERQLHDEKYLNETEAYNSASLIEMAILYAQGTRCDEIKLLGDGFTMLRFSEIKSVVNVLKAAFQEYADGNHMNDNNVKSFNSYIDIIAQMAGFWVSSPISSKLMLEALYGGNTAIMAVNAQMTVSVPGIMLAAMEKGAPVIFEMAMSESDLEGGYTGQLPQDVVDTIKYYAFLLGFDLPYAIHADHTTVKKDTETAIDYARRLNEAQLEAGFTSFAEDPSSLPAVRKTTQLEVLNSMDYGDFAGISGIGEVLARSLANNGDFKTLSELTTIEGMSEIEIANLMNHLESKLLVEVLNEMTFHELVLIPRMSKELASRIAAYSEYSEFESLDELKNIEGLCDADIITIEGMDGSVMMFDYLKTYLDLKRIIEINHFLAKLIPEEFALEVEVGHIGRVDPLTGETVMTTPLEAVVMIEALHSRRVYPSLLAVNNGTVHGNVFVDGRLVPTSVDVKRTDEIARALRPLGVAIAQHGVTGTPFEIIRDYLAGNILKANVGTQWRNIALEYMPVELFKDMVRWIIDEPRFGGPGQFENLPAIDELTREQILTHPVYAPFISKNIKHAIRVFKNDIDNMDPVYLKRIVEETRVIAIQYFEAFNAVGKIQEVIDRLGWGWRP